MYLLFIIKQTLSPSGVYSLRVAGKERMVSMHVYFTDLPKHIIF
jgi:predicted metal-dependent enzyme (double-stranded beta helix superfamily)